MPELPEVETTVKGLNSKVLNRAFVDIWTDSKKLVKRPGFEKFEKEIKGKKIKKIWRKGKNIIFNLSDNYSLLIHQKMTGHLLYGKWERKDNKWVSVDKGPMEDKMNSFLHIIFFLDNGKMLALSDLRKFAKTELWKTEELEFNKIGPDPLEEDFTFEKFKKVLKNKKGKIKQVLMDQELISGIGNIYSSEALWHAKVHPLRDVSSLKENELKDIYNSIKKVLTIGVELGGESFSDYRNIEGEKGNFDNERKAYKREGEKCFRCGYVIKRLKVGGRSAFFCPKCQKI